jgi:methionyl-tRNA synthetase
MDLIWEQIHFLDQKISDTQPFKVIKEDKAAGAALISSLVEGLYLIAFELEPFMPETSKKITLAVLENKKPETLFPRLD